MRKDCYDRENNECDGRCQGASDCPWAQYGRDHAFGLGLMSEPTREDMDRFHEECEEQDKIYKELSAKLDEHLCKDPDLRKCLHMKLMPDGTLKSTFFEDMRKKDAEKSEEG